MPIRKTRKKRYAPRDDETVALYVGAMRLEGRVCDHSESGLSFILTDTCRLEVQQSVSLMFRRKRRQAKIVYVSELENGTKVGVKFT